jgi:hypothetical protein
LELDQRSQDQEGREELLHAFGKERVTTASDLSVKLSWRLQIIPGTNLRGSARAEYQEIAAELLGSAVEAQS